MDNATSEAAAVADLTRETMVPVMISSEDGRQFLVTHDKARVAEVTDAHGLFVHKPTYTKQIVQLQTTASLVDYVERYKLAHTAVFADIAHDRMEAIIDYHGPSEKADFLAHRARLGLARSEEWKSWTGIDNRLMGQLEFARFIEENSVDVSAPEAGALIDVVRDLHGLRKVNFSKAVRMASDNENFEYTVENEAKTKGGVEIPTKFMLRIPVYFGEPPVEMGAFLRWKIDPEGGGISLGLKLHRPEYVRQDEFQRIVREIGESVDRPVVYGTLAS